MVKIALYLHFVNQYIFYPRINKFNKYILQQTLDKHVEEFSIVDRALVNHFTRDFFREDVYSRIKAFTFGFSAIFMILQNKETAMGYMCM